MKLEQEFTVPLPVEEAWEVLTDIPRIAPCMPGAQLTGSDGDVHEGRVKIKVGPVTADYGGTATFVEKDPATRHIVINAKGRDKRGSGNAQAMITADMTPQGDSTHVRIETDLKIAGKVAQFGKGVIGDVSARLIGEFVNCLEHKLAAGDEPEPTQEAVAEEAVAGAATNGAAPKAPAPEPEAIDLMDAAGGAMAKRLAPLVIAALLLLLLGRRKK
ncbi:MAG: SRPBCC family protein [Acidimicrobiales bacterium]